MASQYFAGLYSHRTSLACLVDLTPPTFAGVVSVTPNANGSLLAAWAAAVEPVSPPVLYEIYVQLASESAASLFASGNHISSTHHLSFAVYEDRNGDALLAGVSYRIGVRALDAVGNLDSNVVGIVAVSTGVLTSSLATIAAQIAAASLSIAASADAIGGGVEIEADPDPEIDIEAQNDPEVDIETDC